MLFILLSQVYGSSLPNTNYMELYVHASEVAKKTGLGADVAPAAAAPGEGRPHRAPSSAAPSCQTAADGHSGRTPHSALAAAVRRDRADS
ncbi:hypothetical protein EVAR_18633_1 [Eumeta japonica]|uniref:Uncharacterized protein n=1 Tax=Eumeta variegata TaxID=151549 RepID=A0A4C1U6J7_EUMVA|nr:hypothetical protein EVAR_18633_1 [Eumeta japonica]